MPQRMDDWQPRRADERLLKQKFSESTEIALQEFLAKGGVIIKLPSPPETVPFRRQRQGGEEV